MSPAFRPAPLSLVLMGAGKMGGAMLEGWIAVGLDTAATTNLDPDPSLEVQTFCADKKIPLNPPLRDIPSPKALVLAIKPQTLESATPVIGRLTGSETL